MLLILVFILIQTFFKVVISWCLFVMYIHIFGGYAILFFNFSIETIESHKLTGIQAWNISIILVKMHWSTACYHFLLLIRCTVLVGWNCLTRWFFFTFCDMKILFALIVKPIIFQNLPKILPNKQALRNLN